MDDLVLNCQYGRVDGILCYHAIDVSKKEFVTAFCELGFAFDSSGDCIRLRAAGGPSVEVLCIGHECVTRADFLEFIREHSVPTEVNTEEEYSQHLDIAAFVMLNLIFGPPSKWSAPLRTGSMPCCHARRDMTLKAIELYRINRDAFCDYSGMPIVLVRIVQEYAYGPSCIDLLIVALKDYLPVQCLACINPKK